MSGHRPLELHRTFSGEHYLNHNGCGLETVREAEAEAQHGSTMLATKCQRVIWDFAAEHRIPLDDARILLLDTGVRL